MNLRTINLVYEISETPAKSVVRYEDGDFGFRLHVGFVRFFGCRFFLSVQIALKVSEIESMGSCGSILMPNFFSDFIRAKS